MRKEMISKRKLFPAGLLLLVFVLVACAKAPITNRTQFIILPQAFEMQLGASAYLNMLETSKHTQHLSLIHISEPTRPY